MLLTGPSGTGILVNNTAGVDTNFPFSAGERGTFLLLDLTLTGSQTFTVKVKARANGAGAPTAQSGAGVAAGTYTAYVALVNVTTGAVVAGTTGIAASGLFTLDVSGLEGQIEYDYTSGAGTILLLAKLYTV